MARCTVMTGNCLVNASHLTEAQNQQVSHKQPDHPGGHSAHQHGPLHPALQKPFCKHANRCQRQQQAPLLRQKRLPGPGLPSPETSPAARKAGSRRLPRRPASSAGLNGTATAPGSNWNYRANRLNSYPAYLPERPMAIMMPPMLDQFSRAYSCFVRGEFEPIHSVQDRK